MKSVSITSKNPGEFNKCVKKQPCMIFIHMKDCGHCDEMHKIWSPLMDDIRGKYTGNVNFMDVNSEALPKINCNKVQSINGFPTILKGHKDSFQEFSRPNRSKESLIEWFEDKFKNNIKSKKKGKQKKTKRSKSLTPVSLSSMNAWDVDDPISEDQISTASPRGASLLQLSPSKSTLDLASEMFFKKRKRSSPKKHKSKQTKGKRTSSKQTKGKRKRARITTPSSPKKKKTYRTTPYPRSLSFPSIKKRKTKKSPTVQSLGSLTKNPKSVLFSKPPMKRARSI